MAIYLMNKGKSQFIGVGVQPSLPVKNRRFSRKTARFSGTETSKTSPIEIALQYAEVLQDPSVTSKAEVARRCGVSRARVCQMLKLLELDESILESLKKDDINGYIYNIGERCLRPIAAVHDRNQQVRMFDELISQLYTVVQPSCPTSGNKRKIPSIKAEKL